MRNEKATGLSRRSLLGAIGIGGALAKRASASEGTRLDFDLVIVGGTPAGICAAIAAARMGLKVALTDESVRVGGMLTSGLCHLDKVRFPSVSGIIREWCDLNRDYYLANLPDDPITKAAPVGSAMGVRFGTKFEPHVAEKHFNDLLTAAKVQVFRTSWPVAVDRRSGALQAVHTVNESGSRVVLKGKQFIDATDEGDLAAMAGVPFRVGREPRTPEEPHAGRIFTPAFVSVMGFQPVPPHLDTAAHWCTLLPGSDGSGDQHVQAYTFVMCLKNYAGAGSRKHIMASPPPEYDRRHFENTTPWETLRRWPESAYALPNRKCQFHWAWFGTDVPGWSDHWATASREERVQLKQRFKNRALGFLYFMQHELGASDWGLADDEFPENGNFPRTVYVREARRIEGRIMLNESDIHKFLRSDGIRPPLRRDSIAIGDWPLDSHAVAEIPGRDAQHTGEGAFFLNAVTPPFQVPFDIMVPKNCASLLVPVAASATHVAFGSLRVEQCRSAMGQAAGIAAALAVRAGIDASQVSLPQLQAELLRQRCVLYYYGDITPAHPQFEAIQQLSVRGAFRGDESYNFNPDETVNRGEAARALAAALELPYSISGPHFKDCGTKHPAFRAVETLFDYGSAAGIRTFAADEKGNLGVDEPVGAEFVQWLEAFRLKSPPAVQRYSRAEFAAALWTAVNGRH